MTRFILALSALTLVFAAPTFAARKTARAVVTTCSNAKLDNGFILTSAGRGDKFAIQEQTVAGPLQLAVVTCQNVTPNVRVTADAMVLSKVCKGTGARGDQFEVRISSGGFAFHQAADLFQNGRQLADDMFCAMNPTE